MQNCRQSCTDTNAHSKPWNIVISIAICSILLDLEIVYMCGLLSAHSTEWLSLFNKLVFSVQLFNKARIR